MFEFIDFLFIKFYFTSILFFISGITMRTNAIFVWVPKTFDKQIFIFPRVS